MIGDAAADVDTGARTECLGSALLTNGMAVVDVVGWRVADGNRLLLTTDRELLCSRGAEISAGDAVVAVDGRFSFTT